MIPAPVKAPFYGTRLANGIVNPDLVIPEELTHFSYDLGGRMVQADNRDARVRRAYYANGALKADTSALRSADITASEPTYTSILSFTYDLSGRRTARVDNLGGRQTYAYDLLGQLASTTDSVVGQAVAVTFAYDALGRLRTQAVPSAGTSAVWTYDVEGRPVTRQEAGFSDTFSYDARGKRIGVSGRALMYGGTDGAALHGYDGLGQLVASHGADRDLPTTEKVSVDGQGNVRWRHANRLQADAEQLDSSSYSGPRLLARWGTHFPDGRTVNGIYPVVPVIDSLRIAYDFSGNVEYQAQIKTRFNGSTQQGGPIRHSTGHAWTFNYYDAAERLRTAQRIMYETSPATVFEEYWYDALGRRVAVRSRADSITCHGSGPSFPERCYQPFVMTVWDGDQVLAEDRGQGGWQLHDLMVGSAGSEPWYGRVRYTQTGVIDTPLLLWLNFQNPRVLHRNWRGTVAGATFVNGDSTDTGTVWPAAYRDVWMAPDARQGAPQPNKWLGSLVTDSKDATGTLYRRNRYYDPVSGRFTQEDPIGLAGGLNLYGYANGDPINNSDPFGLCPQELTGRPCGNVLGGAAMTLRTSSGNPRIGEFGMVRNGGTRAHQGLDILASVGISVTAADEGTVVFAGVNGDHGNQVIIGHSNADGEIVSYTSYSHLNSVSVSGGESVKSGASVGTVGKTGNANSANIPAHLHFEIRTANPPGTRLQNRVDPKPELKP